MVEQISRRHAAYKVSDPKVLAAMRKVPRHRFVPESTIDQAYDDTALSIGHGQTISGPFIVGYMTQVLELKSTHRVLEVGTGSGYQAAILAEIAKDVYSIEIIDDLAQRSRLLLGELGYTNVHVRAGDGYRGWPEEAPFDAVIVTCAPDHIPEPLIAQLKPGGRMVIPVGWEIDSLGPLWAAQELILLHKKGDRLEREKLIDVRFVPMMGEAEKKAR